MTAPITTEFLETAKELIDEFIPDVNATWCCVNEGNTDPNKPWEQTKRLITKRDVKIFFFTKFAIESWIKYIQDTELGTGQIQGIMYPYSSFTPNKVDFVEFNGEELTIRQINPLQPIDDVICYFVEFGT